MPNWCDCVITISGSPEDMNEFIKAMKTPGLLQFNDFVPKLEGLPPYESFQWCRTNWGTKWDIGEDEQLMDRNVDGSEITFSFPTAWSPPQPFVMIVSGMYPSLAFHLSYCETGMVFAGYVKYINSEVQYEYSCMWENDDEYEQFYNDTDECDRRAWGIPEGGSYASDAESTDIE